MISGIVENLPKQLIESINSIFALTQDAGLTWQKLSPRLAAEYPFETQLMIFNALFPNWQSQPETAPAWIPSNEYKSQTYISRFMHEKNFTTVAELHEWSVMHFQDFWQCMIEKLGIVFKKNPTSICDLSEGIETPTWFPGGQLNIIDSCFKASPDSIALIYADETKQIHSMSYAALEALTNRSANIPVAAGFKADDAIAIAMPMNHYAVAIYLAIIKMGGVVVSIADSFSSQEMATRLRIADAKAVFTQNCIHWAGKTLPLYEKLCNANAPLAIVFTDDAFPINLRSNDLVWNNFLVSDDKFTSVARESMAPCNILFSSGTTGDPKAIPWNHTTPIKAASDTYFHQDIKPHDVLAWPTNLGWMMGPWVIFAALIHEATLALYPDAPKDRAFGEFISQAKVTMLGVVPTLVSAWRETRCMEGLDWRTIKNFSSTGECSNPQDMLYLMSLAHYKPVIEYCGGTEIGGAYITSTMIENNYPSVFTTKAMGMDFVILNEEGQLAEVGEVAIIPPSIGLSTTLLNADHHKVYYANMPAYKKQLRRHGDQITRLANGCFMILGRADDTMNLGGIKISSAEIERALIDLPQVGEVAAIAVSPPQNGPTLLVIYATQQGQVDKATLLKLMQKQINLHLNPLFKIHDIVIVNELPKTASNKIMRRLLRDKYLKSL